jgi:superfamily II DNA or RNA helicase
MKNLYAYTFPTYWKHKSYVKVGDTNRTVDERVREQFGTSNPEEPVILKEWDIKNHRDHDIHKILKKRDLIRVHDKREWFQCSIKDIDSAVNELLAGIARPNSYHMREEQEEAVNKAYNYYKTGDEFLFNAKMRFGKTFTGYNLMQVLGAKKTLILTYKPATVDGWESDLNEHVNFTEYTFHRALDYSKENPIKFGDGKHVLFASFQDILGKNLNNEPKEKWLEVINQDYDLLIIDEAHYGANSPRAQKFLSSLSVKKVAAMSGTPVKLLMGGVYTDEQIYTWSYVDEQKKRQLEKDGGWQTEVYRWLPVMHMYTYHIGDMVKDLTSYYSEEEGLTLTKFFSSDDGETLNNDKAVEQWLDTLAVKSSRIFNSPFLLDINLKHMFWYLSSVNSVKALAKKLREHTFFRKYKVVVAAHDNEGEGSDTLKLVKDTINKVEKGFEVDGQTYVGTITLSCGKLNTGVSIPELDSVWMLSDTKAVETYMQTIFRAQTSWKKGGKENCYVFDFNPNRALEMVYDYNEYVAKTEQSTPSSIREFLECMNVLSCEDNELKEITVENVVVVGTEPETAIKRFASERTVCTENATLDIAQALVGVEKAGAIKGDLEVSSSDTKNGKSFEKQAKGEPKNKTEKDVFADLKAKAITITKCLPAFLFDIGSIESVDDIISTSRKDVFFEDTGVSVDVFAMMVESGFLNKKALNRAIEAFNLDEEYFSV